MLDKTTSLYVISFAALFLAACGSPRLTETSSRVASGGEQFFHTMEIAAGIRQALEIGITDGANALSAPNGYMDSPYRILLPPEAQAVADRLQPLPGFSRVESILTERLNRAAEAAASHATPIFKQAIRNMSIRDAMSILMGENDAATQYLRAVAYDQLYEEFSPVIIASLDKVHARTYWSEIATAYNRLPIEQTANPHLDDYVTHAALDGLFAMVANKEHEIRTDVNARSTALLRRVFARQDATTSTPTD